METRQVVYIHVHYGVHGEMYIETDSSLIDCHFVALFVLK